MSSVAVADFVARFKDAILKKYDSAFVPYYHVTFSVAWFLYSQGCFKGIYICVKDGKIFVVKISLKYLQTRSLITEFRIISKPGSRVYLTLDKLIKRVVNYNLRGFFVVFTSNGIYTSDQLLLSNFFGHKHSGEVVLSVSF